MAKYQEIFREKGKREKEIIEEDDGTKKVLDIGPDKRASERDHGRTHTKPKTDSEPGVV